MLTRFQIVTEPLNISAFCVLGRSMFLFRMSSLELVKQFPKKSITAPPFILDCMHKPLYVYLMLCSSFSWHTGLCDLFVGSCCCTPQSARFLWLYTTKWGSLPQPDIRPDIRFSEVSRTDTNVLHVTGFCVVGSTLLLHRTLYYF